MSIFRNIWNFIIISENRGALQFILQYVFGPFSIFGILYILYFWSTSDPDFEFFGQANGGYTLNGNKQEITITLRNTGSNTLFAPNSFECKSKISNKFKSLLILSLTTKSDLKLENNDVKDIVYQLTSMHTKSVSIEESTGVLLFSNSSATPAQLINENAPNPTEFNCLVQFRTADQDAVVSLGFWVSPNGPKELKFLGNGLNEFNHPI